LGVLKQTSLVKSFLRKLYSWRIKFARSHSF